MVYTCMYAMYLYIWHVYTCIVYAFVVCICAYGVYKCMWYAPVYVACIGMRDI